jgi:23S rRNA (cytidine1920-2'-O)/16S rRNA (cytidine1409-2'-O)-methyltransferase
VLVDDVPVEKPGTKVRREAAIRVRGETRRFVSRGGDKLAGALLDLGVDPRGRLCLDVGASTGGFTDCLLQAGACGVVAVDVGHGQLDARLRRDPRVVVRERRNARHLAPPDVPDGVELVTLDVSFISATLILPRLAELAPRADLLVLVKPQFEVGRADVGKGGLVKDAALHLQALADVADFASGAGYAVRGACPSPVTGATGNREFFLHLVAGGEPLAPDTLQQLLRKAVSA